MINNYPRGWYAVAESREVTKAKPVPIRRFGIDLVLWRNHLNSVVIQHDLCPHRSVKLSLGTITKQGTLACSFHGMQFDTSGACTHVPETGKPATALCVKTFPTDEKNGFIWLWVGEDAPRDNVPPWFSEIGDKFVYGTIVEHVDCHVTRAIENQLDFVHLAFVHKATIGRGFDPTRKADVIADDKSIKYGVRSLKNFNDSSIHFKMPNIWMNTITKKFRIILAFCPIDDHQTKIYIRTYQSFLPVPVLGKAVVKFMNLTNRLVFREDSRVVNTHPSGPSTNTGANELLFSSDQPIKHFRRIWSSP